MVQSSVIELVECGRVLKIAHRGASQRAPENTSPAFQLAIQAGADFVELDYRHTADGVPVVFHDATLDRATSAAALWPQPAAIHEKTWAELQSLDAGSWFSPTFAGVRIPSLEQALQTICPACCALIERKAGDAATTVDLLRRTKSLERVIVQSFDWYFLADCRQLAPELTLAALGEKQLTEPHLDYVVGLGARVVAWDERTTTAASIAAIHARGLKAWVWTADDPGRQQELIRLGIDGIISNRV